MRPLVKIYILRVILGIIAATLCISYIAATGAILKNLISNPSVESGNTTPQDWFSTGNGTEWATSYARTGLRSIRINVTDSSGEWRSEATEIQGGYAYQILGFFRGTVVKSSFFLSVRWFSDSQGLTLLSENQVSMPIGNYLQWLPLGNATTAPTNARSCEIVFEAVNGTGNMYGDCFEIRQIESTAFPPTKLVNTLSIALIVYLISYYVIKRVFIYKVEKSQKLFTTGIGIYFFTWLIFLILLYTLTIEPLLI